MTKRDLIINVQKTFQEYTLKDISYAVHVMLSAMTRSLLRGERIDIRGFGNFTVRTREPKMGRNPKTSDVVQVPARKIPIFKTGKELKERINATSRKVRSL
jgi:integration host factor subunit beta